MIRYLFHWSSWQVLWFAWNNSDKKKHLFRLQGDTSLVVVFRVESAKHFAIAKIESVGNWFVVAGHKKRTRITAANETDSLLSHTSNVLACPRGQEQGKKHFSPKTVLVDVPIQHRTFWGNCARNKTAKVLFWIIQSGGSSFPKCPVWTFFVIGLLSLKEKERRSVCVCVCVCVCACVCVCPEISCVKQLHLTQNQHVSGTLFLRHEDVCLLPSRRTWLLRKKERQSDSHFLGALLKEWWTLLSSNSQGAKWKSERFFQGNQKLQQSQQSCLWQCAALCQMSRVQNFFYCSFRVCSPTQQHSSSLTHDYFSVDQQLLQEALMFLQRAHNWTCLSTCLLTQCDSTPIIPSST